MGFEVKWYHADHGGTPHRQVYPLQDGRPVTIGRDPHSDIVIDDDLVSRFHADVTVDDDRVYVRDTGSANGLKINGRSLTGGHWLPGQQLTIEPFVFELFATTPAMRTPDRGAGDEVWQASPSAAVHSDPLPPGDPGHARTGRVVSRPTRDLAIENHQPSIASLFSAFLGTTEPILDCGHLGTPGLLRSRHSFWSLTSSRMCGLSIGPDDAVQFQAAALATLTRCELRLPSAVDQWIRWGAIVVGGLILAIFAALITLELFGLRGLSLVMFLVAFGAVVISLPLAEQTFVKLMPTGCVFSSDRGVVLVLPADANHRTEAQRCVAAFHRAQSGARPAVDDAV